MEEKEDAMRRLRQKMSGQREMEERKLKEEAARTKQELVELLAMEKVYIGV